MTENVPKKDWFYWLWFCLWIGIVVFLVIAPRTEYSVPLTAENWPGFILLGALYSIPVGWVMGKIYPTIRELLFQDGEPID
ncbi:MAG: hypothetical protein JAY74_17680 [Candidatus Thiodiazotropha taylori]|nr:hypothetical protein [Candidatus Thiodiazotropha taylori]